MFAKISLNSFIWDVIDDSKKDAVDIYSKKNIIKCFVKLECSITEVKTRNLIFEISIQSKTV